MKIIISLPDRLAMEVGIPTLYPTTLVFDRNIGTLTVERKILFHVFETKSLLLNSIQDVHVVRRKTSKSSSYKLSFTVNVGYPVELAGFDRESSKKAVQLIRDFLGAK